MSRCLDLPTFQAPYNYTRPTPSAANKCRNLVKIQVTKPCLNVLCNPIRGLGTGRPPPRSRRRDATFRNTVALPQTTDSTGKGRKRGAGNVGFLGEEKLPPPPHNTLSSPPSHVFKLQWSIESASRYHTPTAPLPVPPHTEISL